MSDDNHKGSRLPPPAFPPGARRRAPRSTTPAAPGDASPRPTEEEVLDDAMILPEDPIPSRRDPFGAAMISPDDPMPGRGDGSVVEEMEEGIVTSLGDDPHLERHELVSGGDPHVIELMEALAKLAEALKRKGEAGLRATSEMSRFDATLRAYCVGYLAGRRAEDEPLPAFDPFPDF